MADALYLDNDCEVEIALTRKNTTTGISEAAAGLSGVTAHFALTPQGSAIHSDVTITLSERSGTPGTYYGLFDGDKLTTRLGAYANATIWLMITNSAKDLEVVKPYIVRRDRVAA